MEDFVEIPSAVASELANIETEVAAIELDNCTRSGPRP